MFSKLATISIYGLVPLWFAALATSSDARTVTTRVAIGAAVGHSQSGNPQAPLTAAERTRLSERALAYLQRSGLKVRISRNQRLRILSVKRLPAEKSAATGLVASVVAFNYSEGRATRLIMDSSTGAVLREERLRGRPQPSEEELQEAGQIVRREPELARILEAGGILEGGFTVDDPKRRSTRDRFIQFQILTSDRQGLQRFVTVNLTTGRLAESRHP